MVAENSGVEKNQMRAWIAVSLSGGDGALGFLRGCDGCEAFLHTDCGFDFFEVATEVSSSWSLSGATNSSSLGESRSRTVRAFFALGSVGEDGEGARLFGHLPSRSLAEVDVTRSMLFKPSESSPDSSQTGCTRFGVFLLSSLSEEWDDGELDRERRPMQVMSV
jgi:hypothetical protein